MHIVGTRDAAIRKQTQFSWLVQITEDISSLFKAINWVQEKERKGRKEKEGKKMLKKTNGRWKVAKVQERMECDENTCNMSCTVHAN